MCAKEEDMSSYTEGQIHQLADALESAGFTPAEITKFGQLGPTRLNEFRFVLNGRAKIVQVPVPVEPELHVDNMIRVGRYVRPVYPDWVKKVLHPELEKTGPAEYDLSCVEQWLHEGQKNGGWVKGRVIYEHLKNEKMLETCMSLRDLEEIQRKGIEPFRKFFKGRVVFAWKSVVQDDIGGLDVPYLYEYSGKVVLNWDWLDYDWNDLCPALRFAN
jgi:hypothetical protein